MNKLIRYICLFLLFVFSAQGVCASVVPTDGGKYVLAVKHGEEWVAMGTDTYGKKVQVSSDSTALLSFPASTMIWALKSNGKEKFFLEAENGNSLKYKGSGTALEVAKRPDSKDELYCWSLEPGKYGYLIKMNGRKLLYYHRNNDFRNYDDNVPSYNAFPHEFRLFQVLVADSSQSVVLKGDVPWTAASIAALDLSKATGVDFREITLPKNLTLPAKCNPNCLFYVNQEDVLPAEFKNVIRVAADGTASAKDISLTDGTDFFAKMPFTAESVSYSRHLYSGWSTLVLPFNYPLADEQCEAYVNATAGTIEFRTVEDGLVANTPYIIYREADGDVTFRATGVFVPATAIQISGFVGNFTTFTLKKDANLYMMNADGTAFVHSDGTATVGAFRGYLDLNNEQTGAAVRRIVHNPPTSTGIDELSLVVSSCDGHLRVWSAVSQTVGVYCVAGQLVCTLHLNVGMNDFELPLKGLYVVNNNKIYF